MPFPLISSLAAWLLLWSGGVDAALDPHEANDRSTAGSVAATGLLASHPESSGSHLRVETVDCIAEDELDSGAIDDDGEEEPSSSLFAWHGTASPFAAELWKVLVIEAQSDDHPRQRFLLLCRFRC